MDFTFDLATNQLVPTNGVDEIALKWRSREPVRIHFHRDGTDELLPSGFGLALYLKRSTVLLATCTSFTAPGAASGNYTGTLILNTTPLTTAFTTATVLSVAASVEVHWWASGESASPAISDSLILAQIGRPVVAPEPSTVETVTLGYEGTDVKSTGETGGTKYLREDGDGTCSWQTVSGSGSGDALVANNLDQFASVTQTAGQTLAITSSTTLAGGTHSGTNTGDQDLSTLAVKSNNLSDLASASTARTNLGLGTLATQSGTFSGTSSGTNTGDQDLSAYLTSSTASSTYQPLDSDLTSIAGLSKTGNTLKVIRVNAGETAYELATVSGGGGGDAVVSGTLDQFADVTQTAGQTLAITSSTTLAGGTHSGTNSGDNATNTQYSGLVSNATHTGDATGATELTLATVNANVGSYGSATAASSITVNAKGLVTAAASTTITPAVGSITGLGSGVATALAVNVGSAGAPVVNGGALGTPSSGALTNCTGLPTAGLVDDAVTLAKMAAGTAGNLITYDASGNPAAVATGTATHVLTSNGAGAAPTFQAAAGGGGGLTNITETLITSAPNATVNVEQLAVTGGTTNTDLVLAPRGTGAFILGPAPDSTSTGGDKRGSYAVDLQVVKTLASRVASGAYSFLAGYGGSAAGESTVSMGQGNLVTGSYGMGLGYGNTSSSTASVALGYSNTASGVASVALGQGNNASNNRAVTMGYGNTASGDASVALGDTNTASAAYAQASGSYASATRHGMHAHASGAFGSAGDAQSVKFVARNKTTTNAAVELFLNGSSTYLTVPAGKVLHGVVTVLGSKSDGSAVAVYLRQVAIKNVSGTVSLVGSVQTLGTDTAAGTTLAITADDTNDALSIKPTGVTSETWRWTATFDAVEIAYGA